MAWNERRFHDNLTALAERQPSAATLVKEAALPDGIVAATGRDGSPTFRIPNSAGRLDWMGLSSTPTISAAATAERYVPNLQNLSLPGMISGLEPLLLLKKLWPHAALFVFEARPLMVKLAFHLHEYAASMRAGRLVLIAGDDAQGGLRIFFKDYPGYEYPAVLLPVPQQSDRDFAALQQVIEQASAEITTAQTMKCEAYIAGWRRQMGSPPSAAPQPAASGNQPPRVTLVSVDPRMETLAVAGSIASAIATLDWPHRACLPDHPQKCHLLARLQAAAELGADIVLTVNCPPGGLISLAADGQPRRLASWYWPGNAIAADHVPSLKHHTMIFVASQAEALAAGKLGLEQGCVHVLPPPAMLCPAWQDIDFAIKTDIVMQMDLPDARPAACGIDLPSHLRLWQSATQSALAHLDQPDDAAVRAALDAAQRVTGVHLREQTVQEHFRHLIRHALLPALRARVAAEALVSRSTSVQLRGRHWDQFDHLQAYHAGGVLFGKPWTEMLRKTRLLILPGGGDAQVQRGLDAVAAGTFVIASQRATPHPEQHGSLADLGDAFHSFANQAEFRLLAQQALPRGPMSRETAEQTGLSAWHESVRRSHTVAHRLATLVELMRQPNAVTTHRP